MNDFKTFKTESNNGILRVSFDFPPVNIQGQDMLNDLNQLCDNLEKNKTIKVVIFQSLNKDIFIAHYDIDLLSQLSTKPIKLDEAKISPLQNTLNRVSLLPQATIAKIEGMARGGGHEFALACDMRFATIGKAVFMQMEVGMGVLPCGGGSSRIARQTGLGRALEFVLSARDFGAEDAERFGTINKALDADAIDDYVDSLAQRISKFPLESINACKKVIYKSVDLTLEQSLINEDYNLYQCTSQTPAVKRFKNASDENFQNSLENQKNFESLLMTMQDDQA